MKITKEKYVSPKNLIINKRAYHDNLNNQMKGVRGWQDI